MVSSLSNLNLPGQHGCNFNISACHNKPAVIGKPSKEKWWKGKRWTYIKGKCEWYIRENKDREIDSEFQNDFWSKDECERSCKPGKKKTLLKIYNCQFAGTITNNVFSSLQMWD